MEEEGGSVFAVAPLRLEAAARWWSTDAKVDYDDVCMWTTPAAKLPTPSARVLALRKL